MPTGVFFFGGMLAMIGGAQLDFDTGEGGAILWAGFAVATGGFVGMITTGALLGVRKRKLRRLQEAHYATPRRVQWDLAQSRLVF